jgi:hypothetical protein
MVVRPCFITTVISLAVMSVSMMGLVVKLLGDRIGSVEVRMGGMETRLDAVLGSVRDIGARLTSLEADPGKR